MPLNPSLELESPNPLRTDHPCPMRNDSDDDQVVLADIETDSALRGCIRNAHGRPPYGTPDRTGSGPAGRVLFGGPNFIRRYGLGQPGPPS